MAKTSYLIILACVLITSNTIMGMSQGAKRIAGRLKPSVKAQKIGGYLKNANKKIAAIEKKEDFERIVHKKGPVTFTNSAGEVITTSDQFYQNLMYSIRVSSVRNGASKNWRQLKIEGDSNIYELLQIGARTDDRDIYKLYKDKRLKLVDQLEISAPLYPEEIKREGSHQKLLIEKIEELDAAFSLYLTKMLEKIEKLGSAGKSHTPSFKKLYDQLLFYHQMMVPFKSEPDLWIKKELFDICKKYGRSDLIEEYLLKEKIKSLENQKIFEDVSLTQARAREIKKTHEASAFKQKLHEPGFFSYIMNWLRKAA